MAKKKLMTRGENGYGNPMHYFASSLAEWRTGTDLVKLIADMERSGFPFNVYRVELPADAPYEIEYYRPKLGEDKLVWVGFFEWEA